MLNKSVCMKCSKKNTPHGAAGWDIVDENNWDCDVVFCFEGHIAWKHKVQAFKDCPYRLEHAVAKAGEAGLKNA